MFDSKSFMKRSYLFCVVEIMLGDLVYFQLCKIIENMAKCKCKKCTFDNNFSSLLRLENVLLVKIVPKTLM